MYTNILSANSENRCKLWPFLTVIQYCHTVVIMFFFFLMKSWKNGKSFFISKTNIKNHQCHPHDLHIIWFKWGIYRDDNEQLLIIAVKFLVQTGENPQHPNQEKMVPLTVSFNCKCKIFFGTCISMNEFGIGFGIHGFKIFGVSYIYIYVVTHFLRGNCLLIRKF